MKTRLTRTAIFRLLILVLPVVGFPSTGFAQTTTGTILGTVTDQAGAIVPGATVTIKNIETGVTRSITTDESKVVLEDFLMRIKVQSYNLVFVVKILE